MAMALAAAAVLGCHGSRDSVEGRWERVGRPDEWVRFDADGTFTGRSYLDSTLIRGTYEQRGDSVAAASTYGRASTLLLHGSVLVMEDGTEYRRAQRPR